MSRKIIALLLVLVMIVPMIASCGGEEKDKNEETKSTGTDVAETVENEFAEIDGYVEDLVSQSGTYGGETFTMLLNQADWPEEEEITGNLLDDALYNRIRDIEEYFEVDMVPYKTDGTGYETSGAQMADLVFQDTMAGSMSYDLVHANLMTCGQVMLNTGSIRYVEEMDPLDFSNKWWLNDLEDQFSIGGHLYFLTGEIVSNNFTDPACIIFNKKIAENYGLPNLYDIANAGDWTFDKMVEVSSVITPGSGTYSLITGGASGGLCFYIGAGYKIAETDEEGNPTIAPTLTGEQVDFIDKLASVIGDNTVTVTDMNELSYSGTNAQFEAMDDDVSLFLSSGIGAAASLRAYDIDFGILPIPKGTASQDKYISLSSAWTVAGVFFPKLLKNEEMTSTITEAMAALSDKYLRPAFYEKALKGRSTNDVESRRMLDLIYAAKRIDLADTYQWGEVVKVINEACMGEKDEVVSTYNGSAKFANTQIKRLLKQIEKQN
ncbi:MAG: hypothetical protein MJ096_01455 [Clostridia bacterium]|nr:hypothetical protein [Clostridia bacterium]